MSTPSLKWLVGISLLVFMITVVVGVGGGTIVRRLGKEGNKLDSTSGRQTENTDVISGNTLSTTEVLKHNSASDCWIIISNKVYDVSTFLAKHPGGASPILPYCGKDATTAFATKDKRPPSSHSNLAKSELDEFYIGTLGSVSIASSQTTKTSPNATPIITPPRMTTNRAALTANNNTVVLTAAEVAKHASTSNCWLILFGNVYNVTGFLSAHPGGAGAIIPYCGKDGSRAFQSKDWSPATDHSSSAYGMLSSYFVGAIGTVTTGGGTAGSGSNANPLPVPSTNPVPPTASPPLNQNLTLTPAEVATHNTLQNCWLIISGKVYDVTSYIASHPGGVTAITNVCGQDGTTAFQTKGGRGSTHSSSANSLLNNYIIGSIGSTIPNPTPPPGTNPTPPPSSGGSCSQGVLPASVTSKYPGATIVSQKIEDNCAQELRINYNGQCRSLHVSSSGSISEDERC